MSAKDALILGFSQLDNPENHEWFASRGSEYCEWWLEHRYNLDNCG